MVREYYFCSVFVKLFLSGRSKFFLKEKTTPNNAHMEVLDKPISKGVIKLFFFTFFLFFVMFQKRNKQ